MERELELLAESVFSFWNNAAILSEKNALPAAVGDMSAHIMSALIGADGFFYFPEINSGAFERAHRVEYPDINKAFETNRDGKTAALNAAESGKTVGSDEIYLNYAVRDGGAAPTWKDWNVKAFERGSATDNYQWQLKTVYRTLEQLGHEMASVAKTDPMYMMSDIIRPALLTDAAEYQTEDVPSLQTVENMPAKGRTGSDLHLEGDIGSSGLYAEENVRTPIKREIFNDISAAQAQNTKYQTAYRENRAVDIKFIGEVLARELHEQIAAGFPMYMR